MTTHHQREDALLVRSQLFIFTLAFILPFIASQLPEKTGEPIFKTVDMLFICGTILLSVKLAREGWDMAAAGFVILGIGWGILFAAMDFAHLHMDMEVRTSAAYFFVPCMLLIACYRPFPWWLKLLTIWCMVPFVIALVLQKTNPHNEALIRNWLILGGFNSFHTVSLIWAIFFYRQWKKQHRAAMAGSK